MLSQPPKSSPPSISNARLPVGASPSQPPTQFHWTMDEHTLLGGHTWQTTSRRRRLFPQTDFPPPFWGRWKIAPLFCEPWLIWLFDSTHTRTNMWNNRASAYWFDTRNNGFSKFPQREWIKQQKDFPQSNNDRKTEGRVAGKKHKWESQRERERGSEWEATTRSS